LAIDRRSLASRRDGETIRLRPAEVKKMNAKAEWLEASKQA